MSGNIEESESITDIKNKQSSSGSSSKPVPLFTGACKCNNQLSGEPVKDGFVECPKCGYKIKA